MKILVVSPWLPHSESLHAGGQTLYQVIRALSERNHNVHVLCYNRQETDAQIATLASHCTSLTWVTPAYSWQQKLIHLLQTPSWRLGRRTHYQMHHFINRLCKLHSIDIVHLAWTEMGRYIDAVPEKIATILHTLDVESRVRPREVSMYTKGLPRWQAYRRMYRLINIEKYATPKADMILASSRADRQALAVLAEHDRIQVFVPWVGTINADISPLVPARLTYMGAMDRIANVAAAHFLIDGVWPLIHQKHPGTSLHIVGANPPQSLMQPDNSSIVVTGFQKDLGKVWAETDVAVSPSMIGGGLLVKVAQPMLAGRPVVTTSFGNEGVGASNGVHLAVADTPQSFADKVGCLLVDRDYWKAMAKAGQTYARHHFDWARNLDNLDRAYEGAIRHAKEK